MSSIHSFQRTGRKNPVAIHDISAANYSKMEELIKILRGLGWQKIQLATIPGGDEIPDAFASWCCEQEKWGAEFWIHGFKHRSPKTQFTSAWVSKIQKSVSWEAEFLGLTEEESEELLQRALQAWESAEMPRAQGFVPPTWHADSFLENMVLSRGLEYEGRLHRSGSLGERSRRFPISLPVGERGWDLSLAIGKMIMKWSSKVELVLHPSDFSGKKKQRLLSWLGHI